MTLFRRFKNDNRGNTTVIMGMVIVILMAMCGIIIDLGYMVETKARLYYATMAGVDACFDAYDATKFEEDGRIELMQDVMGITVNDYLTDNMDTAWVEQVSVRPAEPNKADIFTRCKVKPIFMQLFGVDEQTLKVHLIYTIHYGDS